MICTYRSPAARPSTLSVASGSTDRFSTAPGTRQPLPAARAPLGTAPDLQVSELDLDAASSEGSMLPPPPSEAPLTPEEFERASQRTVIPHSNARASNRPPGFEIDPELADLFAPEEVVEDSYNLDRMSDIVLDPAEFDNQAFVDEGEQTQVLSERGVAALRSAPTGFEVPQSTGAPHSSQRSSSLAGSEHEHQAVSPSIFPTAPPPGHSNGPPQFSRASDPVTRHPTAPSTPFRPAPSSPDLDAPAAPSGDSDRPVRSAPPVLVRRGSAPPSAPVPSASKFTTPPAAKSSRPALTEPVVDGVNLETARGFEDLPPEVQLLLANQARIEELNEGEEVSFFGAAIVSSGTVDILPAFSDESGAVAHSGDVVFTKGHLEESIDLRVAAKLDGTRIAVWEPDTLRAAIAECPWVEDELQLIADRYLAVCGAALGALGERLDDTLRATVFQRLEVRTYTAGEVLAEEDKPIPALFLLGGGRIEICDAQGNVTQTLSMGDFLFSQCLLGGSKAPGTAKAGPGGALVLTASRHVAHELIMSVPPLVEILAG